MNSFWGFVFKEASKNTDFSLKKLNDDVRRTGLEIYGSLEEEF